MSDPSIFKKVKESAALSSHTITVERNDDGNGDLEQDNATAQAKDHDQHGDDEAHDDQSIKGSEGQRPGTTITWASDTARPPRDTALKIPSPRDREKGRYLPFKSLLQVLTLVQRCAYQRSLRPCQRSWRRWRFH